MGNTQWKMQHRLEEYLDKQIADQRIPCYEVLVSHKGEVVAQTKNVQGVEEHVHGDLIYRMYSMSKPIATVAALVLFEQGKFQLSQPIWWYLGDAWKKENMKVIDLKASAANGFKELILVPCQTDITIQHLITHTSGLSHGLTPKGMGNPLDDYYIDHGLGSEDTLLLLGDKKGLPDLKTFCDALVKCPLLFQPGTQWQYSYGLCVIGYLVELLSGTDLDKFVQENICKKLGMTDTTFHLSPEQTKRLAPYTQYDHKNKVLMRAPPGEPHFPRYASGSAGLFSTTSDYHKFSRALLNRGVGDSGQRILSPRTVDWMFENHLRRDGRQSTIQEMSLVPFGVPPGYGFGLGGSVALDTGYPDQLSTLGEFSWAGAVSTIFWISPKDDLVVVFMTSVFEPDKVSFPIHTTLHSLVQGNFVPLTWTERLKNLLTGQ